MTYTLYAVSGQYVVSGLSVALRWSGAPAVRYPQVVAVTVMGV